MPDITINNIKNITQLEFDIPRNGVFVLTGSNGSGKTTLLATLERLANPNAFPKYFKTSSVTRYNSFRNGTIIYTVNGTSVSYRYLNLRWAPTPRKNAVILRQFGFTRIFFISFDSDRIFIQEQDIVSQAIRPCRDDLKNALNQIFSTTKFADLRQIKIPGKAIRETRRNLAYILPVTSGATNVGWYTEKNFSLGEILLINVVYQLLTVPNGSLILVDEVELALHPKVQVNLLRFLNQIAAQKNLTVVISTHSTSIIKAASKLIHLERNNATGVVTVDYDCYPALALQDVAFEEEVQPDVIFFVEDQSAKSYLEEITDYYFSNLNHNRKPIFKILPVAGWNDTMRFLVNSTATLVPRNVNSFCLLDADVQPIIAAYQLDANRSEAEQAILNLYNQNHNRILFLPTTPELGLCNYLSDDTAAKVQSFRDFFGAPFDLAQILFDESQRAIAYPANPRKTAKIRLDYYVQRVSQTSGWDEKRTIRKLFQYFVHHYYPNHQGELLGLLNPIFN